MARNIQITLDAVQMHQIREVVGNAKMHEAIGYLCSWNMTFPELELHGGVYDGVPEIVATYRREAGGPISYQIGAVWHDDHFGFHS